MDKDAVKKFALLVGTRVEGVSSAGWAQVKCPLAPWTHDTGKDSNPSAAIKIKKKGSSRFTCFTCESGDLNHLLRRLKELGAQAPKYQLKAAFELLATEDDDPDAVLDIRDFDDPVRESDDEEDDGNNDATFPEEWLGSFKRALDVPAAMDYLAGRGVSPETAEALDIRFDSAKGTVCFPLRDFEGVLCGLRGRRIAPSEDEPSYHMYKAKPGPEGKYNRRVWLGEHTIDMGKPVLMVESVFDYAAVWPHYRNVLAPLTVGMSRSKLRRVSGAYDVVTLFDLGAGGNKARGIIDKYLPDSVRLHLLPTGPHFARPGEKAKDPGEMEVDKLRALLSEHLPLEDVQ